MKHNRKRADPVTPELRLAVLSRDQGCVAVTLGESASDCLGRLELDHVKDQPRMGVRAPSDEAHLVTLCHAHHQDGWATSHRPELREYLAANTGDADRLAELRVALDDRIKAEPT